MDKSINPNSGPMCTTGGNDISSKNSVGSSTDHIATNKTPGTLGSMHKPISGPTSRDNVGSTYRATIRTPMNSSSINSGMNASLTALEGEEGTDHDGLISNLSGRAKQMASSTMDSIGTMKESLLSRASRLSDQVTDMSMSAKDTILDKSNMLSSRVKNYDYGHVVDEARTTLCSDPARTMLIAGGVGLALGFMIGRKR